jgi:CBS domain containing-hemolysin-like protein
VAGESVTCDGLRLEVERVSGRRIERVIIVRVAGHALEESSADAAAERR